MTNNMKNIIIIGGGISGSAVLHYLKKKYTQREDVDIRLLEKKDRLGGTATTLYQANCIFETGPNGFLDNKQETLRFIKDLNLEEQLIRANSIARKRYLCLKNRLYLLPTRPQEFLSFSPLSWPDKMRALMEFFVAEGQKPQESVYDFGLRRFGEQFTELLLDAMISGIYAGDIRQLNFKLTFPSLYQMEQKYGSLLKGLMALKRQMKDSRDQNESKEALMGTLASFQSGMSQFSLILSSRYKDSIFLNHKVESINRKGDGFELNTPHKRYEADEIFLCVPAFAACDMVRGINAQLADLLMDISYAPVAVVGLVFNRTAFHPLPVGFGYLIPHKEGKSVLGVIFESNVFPNRTDKEHFLIRVMIGGDRHKDILQKSEGILVQMAQEEIKSVLHPSQESIQHFIKVWPQAIPQYDGIYYKNLSSMEQQINQEKRLFLVANYMGGVSLSDCILNAKLAAQKSLV